MFLMRFIVLYVAETGLPATSDAACLMISRTRNVQIVGKTNLSEFAVAPSGVNDFFGMPKSPLSEAGLLNAGRLVEATGS